MTVEQADDQRLGPQPSVCSVPNAAKALFLVAGFAALTPLVIASALFTIRQAYEVGFFEGEQPFAVAGIGFLGASAGVCVTPLMARRCTYPLLAWRLGIALTAAFAGYILIGQTSLFIRY